MNRKIAKGTRSSRHFGISMFVCAILLSFVVSSVGCGGSGGAAPAPGLAPSPHPDQTERFRVENDCTYTIWIQQQNMPSSTPDVVEIAAGTYYDYEIPTTGQASTRFWVKSGCDTDGNNCTVGQSSGPCPAEGCSPPVDSKMEATWGCTQSSGCTVVGNTFYNSSAVDGFTVPFKVSIVGTKTGSACIDIDCSDLDLTRCPTDENLSVGEGGSSYDEYANADLRVMNAADEQIGCYSPCGKFTYPRFGGYGLATTTDPAIAYCCPTPPVTSDECRAGPVGGTQYVQAADDMCAGGGYGYAYDDLAGNHNCLPETKIKMTFCK